MKRLAYAVATVSALAVSVTVLSAVSPRFGIGPGPTHPEEPELRREGEIIVFKTDGITACPDVQRCTSFVRAAEWSPDGRRLAFQVSHASLDGPPLGPCGPTVGLWVMNALGDLRQRTTPCDVPPLGSDIPIQKMWA